MLFLLEITLLAISIQNGWKLKSLFPVVFGLIICFSLNYILNFIFKKNQILPLLYMNYVYNIADIIVIVWQCKMVYTKPLKCKPVMQFTIEKF